MLLSPKPSIFRRAASPRQKLSPVGIRAQTRAPPNLKTGATVALKFQLLGNEHPAGRFFGSQISHALAKSKIGIRSRSMISKQVVSTPFSRSPHACRFVFLDDHDPRHIWLRRRAAQHCAARERHTLPQTKVSSRPEEHLPSLSPSCIFRKSRSASRTSSEAPPQSGSMPWACRAPQRPK
jgi:hypothetical protein